MDILNYLFYMDNQHRYMFDEENLEFVLQKAGFKSVKMRDFDPSIDLEERRDESLSMEAIKE